VRISPSEECEGPLVAGVDAPVVRRERANEDLSVWLALILSGGTSTYQCRAPFSGYATLTFGGS
jgi:hypothetical protein